MGSVHFSIVQVDSPVQYRWTVSQYSTVKVYIKVLSIVQYITSESGSSRCRASMSNISVLKTRVKGNMMTVKGVGVRSQIMDLKVMRLWQGRWLL